MLEKNVDRVEAEKRLEGRRTGDFLLRFDSVLLGIRGRGTLIDLPSLPLGTVQLRTTATTARTDGLERQHFFSVGGPLSEDTWTEAESEREKERVLMSQDYCYSKRLIR